MMSAISGAFGRLFSQDIVNKFNHSITDQNARKNQDDPSASLEQRLQVTDVQEGFGLVDVALRDRKDDSEDNLFIIGDLENTEDLESLENLASSDGESKSCQEDEDKVLQLPAILKQEKDFFSASYKNVSEEKELSDDDYGIFQLESKQAGEIELENAANNNEESVSLVINNRHVSSASALRNRGMFSGSTQSPLSPEEKIHSNRQKNSFSSIAKSCCRAACCCCILPAEVYRRFT